MNPMRSRALAAAAGGLAGGATFVWLVADLALAGTIALTWAVGVRLTLRYRWLLSMRAETRRVSLWSGAFAALVTLSAFFGVGPSLPLSAELRFALGLLVVGVGYASVTLGVAMASGRTDDAPRESREGTEAGSS
ncbi:sterol desaturase [Halococcus qingdaonensis]|uniref:sterol desaturase n=1 Tax=Halococcus qingdaonensis TaxID=224402 RepID=UPI00211615D3|nr:sterol desaturase [Halococcus qingdaonensis]